MAPGSSARPIGFIALVVASWLVGNLAMAASPSPPLEGPPNDGHTVTVRQAFELAWRRSAEATEVRGQLDIAQANSQVFQSWFAAPPSLAVTQREPYGATAGGERESALAWVVPLWKPAYRKAGEVSSAAEVETRRLAESVLRLQLAGRVRSLASSVRLADLELSQSRRHASSLDQIAAEVRRRVDAGDLAPADRMAAQADRLAALVQLNSAEATLKSQLGAWHVLTGLTVLPGPAPAVADVAVVDEAGLLDQHPEKLLALARVEWARGKVALARHRPAALPELGLGMRQEQPRIGGDARNSLAMSIRIPMGGDLHTKPAITTAIAEQALAEVQADRLRDRLISDLALARLRRDSEAAQSHAAGQRAELLAERARLIEQSFRAGESSLMELLRALALQGESALALARREELFNFARMQVSQALGVMP